MHLRCIKNPSGFAGLGAKLRRHIHMFASAREALAARVGRADELRFGFAVLLDRWDHVIDEVFDVLRFQSRLAVREIEQIRIDVRGRAEYPS